MAFQIDFDGTPSRKGFMNTVWSAVVKLYGEHGASLTRLSLIEYDEENKRGIIRTSLVTLNLVRASLASITSMAGKDATVHILAISGTIKALREKLKL